MAVCRRADAAIGLDRGAAASAAGSAGVVLTLSAGAGRRAALAGNWRNAAAIAFRAGGGRPGLRQSAEGRLSRRGLCRAQSLADAVRAATALSENARWAAALGRANGSASRD